MSHRSLVHVAALAVASTLTGSVLAQTTYTDAGSGLWNDPLNWNAGVPTSTSSAILPAGGAGSITLGTAVTGQLTVNDNYVLTGGTLTVGSGTISNTNGSIYVADGSTLTLANDVLVAGTTGGVIRLGSLTTPPASALGNGIIRLGSSQSGLASAGRIVLGGGTGNGVIVEFSSPAAFGGSSVLLDNGELGGGNFQFGGLDQSFATPSTIDNRNEIVLLRYTGSGAVDLPNPTWGSSPFRYLFVENAGNTFTLSGEMKRRDGGNQRINTVASWNGTTVRVGAPTVGGNPDYLLDNNTTVGLTGNKKANGIGVAAVNGKIEVYRANQPTYSFAQAFGGAIANSDTDLHMGIITGVRGQDAATVNPVSVVEFYNQSQGGAIADANGISQYHYSSLVNESARYQVPRGQNMVPLEIVTNANTNVNVSLLGAGVGIDARGDIVKKGPGTLTIISGRGDSPVVAGGVAYVALPSPPPGYPPANYEGLIDVREGGLVFKTTANTGPSSDVMFDGGTGSVDEARTGVVNYSFAHGTSLTADLQAGALAQYNFKSDVTIGNAPASIVEFNIATGGSAPGKSVGFGSGLALKTNPTVFWNGTLKKTGAGELVFGGGSRLYQMSGGTSLHVEQGRARIEGNLSSGSFTILNDASLLITPTGFVSCASITGSGNSTIQAGGILQLTGYSTYTQGVVQNDGTIQVSGGVVSFANLNGSGTTSVHSVAILELQGSNSQGTLNITTGTLAVDIASPTTFDSINVSGTANLGFGSSSLTVGLVGLYEPAHSDTFTIISSSNRVGTFSNLNAWGLINVTGGGKAFLPEYTATDVILTEFTKVGDVNFDNTINNQDIAPFVAVLTGGPVVAPSSLGFAADVNGDGVVNNQDIAPFVALLTGGRPVGDVAGDPEFAPLIALVPEPASLSLLALGGLALRRRRAR